jgi:hypothetical protein
VQSKKNRANDVNVDFGTSRISFTNSCPERCAAYPGIVPYNHTRTDTHTHTPRHTHTHAQSQTQTDTDTDTDTDADADTDTHTNACALARAGERNKVNVRTIGT